MDLKQEIERRRTFAIISHPDAGKTTPRGLGLDGTRKAARHLHHVVGHAV